MNTPTVVTVLGMYVGLLSYTPMALTQTESAPLPIPAEGTPLSRPSPDRSLTIQQQDGNCPEQVGLWAFSLPHGSEAVGSATTVVVDTLAIAQQAELDVALFRYVKYRALLNPVYASCVGQAIAPDLNTRLVFEDGYVSVVVDVRDIAEGTSASIKYHDVVGERPYIIWEFLE